MLAVLEVDAVVCKNLICADARKRGAMNTKGLLRRASAFVFSTALALSLLAGSTPATQANAATKKNDTIVILHTNDIHAQTDQTVGEDGKVARIGFPAVAKYKKDMVKKYGKSNVTLLDAGDSMQGENIATVSKGLNIIKIMNKVGYDVAIPGNHEFDYSFDNML
jgi:2',3'-cyclic-nucleotide 2'-phosphodiesterase (5'-nucleotidase family)